MMKTTLSMVLALLAVSTQAQMTQNWESGSISSEQAKGWAFGAQGLKCPTCTPAVPFASGGGSAIQGSYSSETNALSNPANVFASWVKTPWAIWESGTISLDARLGATHTSTYKIVFLFIPWDKCAANEEGTATAIQYEYTMTNNLLDQTVSFSVPSVVLDGKPWKMRVGFSGTGGSTRIRHDNWSLPAKAAFYDTDADNIPDAMDKYPTDATNDGKSAILTRVWNDLDADGIQDNCEPGIMGVSVTRGTSTETTRYNGYAAFFDFNAGSQTLSYAKPANTFAYYTLENEGSDDAVDSDVCGSGRTTFSVSGVSSNVAVGFVTPRVTQNWESGNIASEQAKGWAFGAHSIKNGTTVPFQAQPGTDATTISGSWSAETNVNTNSSPTSSWVQTPWSIWAAGTISLDARMGGSINGATSRKISFRFYPWNQCANNQQGTPTSWLYEYDMVINSDVQTVSFPVPSVVLDGKPWRMQVGFSGAGGTSRIRHDNWSYPAAAAFSDTDGDNIPDAMDEYPADNTNDGKAVIFARAWNDKNADGIQNDCDAGIEGVTTQLRTGTSASTTISTENTKYNGYVAFFCIPTGSSRVVAFVNPSNSVVTGQNIGANDDVDSDIDNANSRTSSFTVTGVVSNVAGGFLAPGSVNTFVWDDLDGDGIQDAGEPGLPNITVTLRSGTTGISNKLAETTTDANGIATFTNLVPLTNYRLAYERPAGYSLTGLSQGSDDTKDSDADPNNSAYSIPAFQITQGGQVIDHVDCGMWSPGTITTYVWDDANQDGIQDAGESGISGVQVRLRNGAATTGGWVATAYTNSSGIATFSNVATGTNYRLHYWIPTGFSGTAVNVGSDDAVDSDAEVISAPIAGSDRHATAIFSLTKGNQNFDIMDCGFYSSTQPMGIEEEQKIQLESGNTHAPLANGGNATGNVQQVQKPAAAGVAASRVLAGVSIYPNPATAAFNVAIMAPEAAAVSYVLTDATGKTVRNGNWQISAGANTFTLDVLELKGGVYHLRTEGGQINHSARVIVVK